MNAFAALRGTARVLGAAGIERPLAFAPRWLLHARRDAAIRSLVAHAIATVPFYRELFAERGLRAAQVRGAAELRAMLPVIDKATVRPDPRRFHSDTVHDTLALRTTGTTGEPLELRWNRRAILSSATQGLRETDVVRRLTGTLLPHRELGVGMRASSVAVVGAFMRGSHLLPRRRRLRTLEVTTPLPEVVAMLERWRPHVLRSYGSYLDLLLRYLVARRLEPPMPRVLVFGSDGISPEGRTLAEQRSSSACAASTRPTPPGSPANCCLACGGCSATARSCNGDRSAHPLPAPSTRAACAIRRSPLPIWGEWRCHEALAGSGCSRLGGGTTAHLVGPDSRADLLFPGEDGAAVPRRTGATPARTRVSGERQASRMTPS